MKKCSKCKQDRDDDCFYISRNKLSSSCKICAQEYYQLTKDKRIQYAKDYARNNKDAVKAYQRQHYESNKEYYSEYDKSRYQIKREEIIAKSIKYAQNNLDKVKSYRKDWADSNREYFNSYVKERKRVDVNFKLGMYLRSRTHKAIVRGQRGGSAVQDLGCSIEELKTYLESKFQPGMTWDSYGHKGWHIDHITPLCSFNLTDPEQFKKACHYTNLQPLWAKDNLSKGSKILKD